MRAAFILYIIFLLIFTFPSGSYSDDEPLSCPEKCVESRKNCELSCSQIVGGGAKSRERRECIKSCGVEQEDCNYKCANPTPRPTQMPERYHKKPCERACELKASDCNAVCTKYTGGGAKSEKKAICREDCEEGLDSCKQWCVNPTPKPTRKPDPIDEMPCPEACKYKNLNCESNCSVFLGGGAKSEKRGKCLLECKDFNNQCLAGCEDSN